MKERNSVRRGRTAGGRWRPAAFILAAVFMVFSLSLFGEKVFASSIDLDRDCSLTISAGSMMLEELPDANVEIDLYRVADAIPVEGFDTYDWQVNEPFASRGITIDKNIDNAGWRELANKAANIVLGEAPEGKTEWDPSDSIKDIPDEIKKMGQLPDTKIEPLTPGLYLILAHGSDIAEYATTDTSAAPAAGSTGSTAETAAAVGGTATIAHSRHYLFKFSPELISIPARTMDSTQPSNTADREGWYYDAAAMLKPSQSPRLGNLEIEKDLLDYAQREKTTDGKTRLIKDPATVVFDVSVYSSEEEYDPAKPGENRIYHNNVSVVFDAYGKKSVLIENLPAYSYAVVKEVYAGQAYTIDDTVRTETILANETVTIPFEDEYDDTHGGGGSVTNKFTYKAGQSKWGWEQMTDSSQNGTVIQSDATTNKED